MIKTESLQANWIQEASGKLKADRLLTEKVVWALWLLEGLAASGQPFIFKGGTALMLKLDSTRRLSIDIDIVMPSREEGLPELMNKVARQQGFIRVEEQVREAGSKIPKTHFKFFYKPLFQNTQETYVLLDILFGNAGYQNVETITVEVHSFYQKVSPHKFRFRHLKILPETSSPHLLPAPPAFHIRKAGIVLAWKSLSSCMI